MKFPQTFDFCVLGGGLAGLAIAGSLLDKGATVCLIDTAEIASGASGTPLGLVNPATGRFGTKAWRADECLTAITTDLEQVQAHTDKTFYKNTGILRPAQDAKMARRMKENAEQQDWPENWCNWLVKSEIAAINPEVRCVDGGIWLPKGLTVHVELYLKEKARVLSQKGLNIYTRADYKIQESARNFECVLSHGTKFEAKQLIHTSGFDTKNSAYWNFLPLIPVKGQVAIFESPAASEFDYSISALGYMASLSNRKFVAGSTYEHHFDHRAPDKEGLEYLIKRLGKVYPALFKEAVLIDQWAGVRASTPNRKPFLGQHPDHENIYVFAGLGSKGMLYSSYMAQLLAQFILEAQALPKEISVSRL